MGLMGQRVLMMVGCVTMLFLVSLQQMERANQFVITERLVLPILTVSPVLDGKTSEPVWQFAAAFNLVNKLSLLGKAGIDSNGFWFSFESKSLLPTACITLGFRTSEVYDCVDEFSLLADGRGRVRRLRLSPFAFQTKWRSSVVKLGDQWSAEVFIPFATLGLKDIQHGDALLLDLNWQIGGRQWNKQFQCHLGKLNLLSSHDLSDKNQWRFSGEDAPLYESSFDQGKRGILIKSPGRYSTMSQLLRLRPNSLYRLEAEVKGEAVIYLRARTARRRGEPTEAYTVWTKPSREYCYYSVRFPTGETGEALIVVGTIDSSGKGEVFVRDLKVANEVQFESFGKRIEVQPNGSPVIAEKVLVEDCRALRGFIVAPVDGRMNSVRWDGGVWEYNLPGAGAGVGYAYRNNDGLHIILADDKGVDAILVRGGARCGVYADVKGYDDPRSGRLLTELSGMAKIERVSFPTRVASRKFSFFNVRDGLLADVTFLRVHRDGQRMRSLGTPIRWLVTSQRDLPMEIEGWLNKRFDEPERTVHKISPIGQPALISLKPGGTIHFVSEPLPKGTTLTAVMIEANVKSPGTICPLTIVVQDPLNQRIELMRSDFAVRVDGKTGSESRASLKTAANSPSERIRIVMDFPDQILSEQNRLWLSLSSRGELILSNAAVKMFVAPIEKALSQALLYRKLLMRGLFAGLSEARPWTGLYRGMDVEQWLQKQGAFEPHLRELFETIEQCQRLSGTVKFDGIEVPKDPLVRQYGEWVFRYHKPLSPFPPKIERIPNAPEWAVVLRQAWLTARKVPEWWLDNRLVPTGEFGGEVGDDTDMYQNYADFPMFEDGQFVQRLKDAAKKLMRLAEQTTLEQGINKRTMDPLHAYEEGVNQEALLLWWDYGDPIAFERCLIATFSLQALTTVTQKGHRHFKSQRLGAEDLHIDRKPDVDGHAHPLMLHPAFEVAWYSGNPTVMKFLREWADGWLEHMKPGEYATSVEVATERVIATTDTPICGGYGSLGSAMAFMFWLTGDEGYIEPFIHLWRRGIDRASPGNLLSEMFHRGVLDKIGRETLLKLVRGRGVAEWLVTGDKKNLTETLKNDIAEIQRFWDMYTTAEPFTDRVFLYAITNAAIAYTGGYATRNKFNHTHAVSWEGFGTDFAALVQIARPKRLKVLVYNFASKPLIGRMKVWTLEPGRYKMRIGLDKDNDDNIDTELSVNELALQRADAIPLTLQKKQVTIVEVEQIAPLPPLFPRPDLALSAKELRLEGNNLIVTVHNIGSADAPETTLLVRDRSGRGIIEMTVPLLKAPLDLQPKVHVVKVPLPPTALKPLQVIVDPQNRIAEIYEGNNLATVR